MERDRGKRKRHTNNDCGVRVDEKTTVLFCSRRDVGKSCSSESALLFLLEESSRDR